MQKLNERKINMLIDLVQANPVLYDKFDRRIEGRSEAWKDISRMMNVDEAHCRTAWRSLRDQYMKCLRKRKSGLEGNENKRQYRFFSRLSFLNGSADTNEIQDHYFSSEDNDDEDYWGDMKTCTFGPEELSQQTCTLPNPENPLSTSFHDQTEKRNFPFPSTSIKTSPEDTTPQQQHQQQHSHSNVHTPRIRASTPTPHATETGTKQRRAADRRKSSNVLLPILLSQIVSAKNQMDGVDKFFLGMSSTVKRYELPVSQLALFQCKLMIFATQELEKLKKENCSK